MPPSHRDLTATLKLMVDSGDWTKGFKSAEQAEAAFIRQANRDLDRQRRVYKQSSDAQMKYFADLEAKAKRHDEITSNMGKGFLVAGAAIGVGLLAATKANMGFEKSMSGVKAVSNATAGEMDRLRQAALKAGADTSFSASEAANAEAELAKVGISTADILGGALRGSLDLAAAGQLDLAEAATISGQAMKIFNLEGKDVGHIADLLAAGANKSAADVHQLGESLKMGGQVAAQAGLSIEDTVGALAMFSNNALIGSDAGTSLKTMLIALMNPSKESSALMKQLGLNAYDATGSFVGLQGLASQLQSRLGGLTDQQRDQALAQIFGNDAVRAANILYKEGAGGVEKYTKAVNDQGAAGRMAATQLDNLAGDLDAFKGSLETALIQSGGAANGSLRALTQTATSAVNVFNDMPGPVQKATTILGGAGAAALTAVGGFLVLAPRIKDTKAALSDLNITGDRMKGWSGKLAIGAGVLAGYTAFIAAVDAIQNATMDAAPGVERLTGSLIDYARTGSLVGPMTKLFGQDMNKLGEEIRRVTDKSNAQGFSDMALSISSFGMLSSRSLKEARQDLGSVDQALANLVSQGRTDLAAQAFGQMATAAGRSGASVSEFKSVLPGYAEALAGAKNQTELAKGSTERLGGAIDGTTTDMKEQKSAADQLKDAIDRLNGANQNAYGSQITFEGAVDSLTASMKENGRTMNVNTERGRANRSAVLAAAQAAQAHAQAVADQTGSVDKGNAILAAHRERMIRAMIATGMNRAEARRYVDQVLKIPKTAPTQVKQPGMAQSKADALTLRQRLQDIPKSLTIPVRVKITSTAMGTTVWSSASVSAAAHGRAYGGWIPGSSPSDRADDVLIKATAKEYMIQRPAARYLQRKAPGLLDRLNQAHKLGGDPDQMLINPRGYAGGGAIAATSWSRAQVGEPYSWGGVGPNAWDCSGYAGGAYAVAQGKNPNRRYFTTATVASAPGISPGRGAFTFGVNTGGRGIGHMAFEIMGQRFEATPPRIRAGSSARSVGSFNRQYHLSGVSAVTSDDLNRLMRMIAPGINASVARVIGFRSADSGAVLRPGWNAPLYNGTGRPEHLVPLQRTTGSAAAGRSVTINAPITITGVPDAQRVRMEVQSALRSTAREVDALVRSG